MPFTYPLRKNIQYQQLDQAEVHAVDTSDFSDNIFVVSDFPTELTAGKNSFKILCNGDQLQSGTDILVEVLDANNKPIYREINSTIDRLGRRIISIFVYSGIISGNTTIILLGVLKANLVPEQWKNKYNVKWQKIVPLDSLKRNKSEIIFERYPNVQITEQFRPAISLNYISGSFIAAGSSSLGLILPGDVDSMYDTNLSSSVSYTFIRSGIANAINFNDYSELYTDEQYQQTNATQSAQLNYNSAFFTQNKSPEITDYRIESPFGYSLVDKSGPTVKLNTTGSKGFIKKMIGGKFTVVNPKRAGINYASSYSTVISDVLNEKTLRLKDAYKVSISGSKTGEFESINEFGPNFDYSIDYKQAPVTTGSQAYKTFATINFNNVSILSGDIYRVKTYAKSRSQLSDFELIGNNVITTQNVLIDTGSLDMNLEIGSFVSQSIIDKYWNINSNPVGCELKYNSTYILDGAYATGSLNKMFVTPISNSFPVFKNNQYRLNFNCHGINIGNGFKLKTYISGSGFYDSDFELKGKYIGKIEFNEFQRTFQDLNLYFEPDKDGKGKPVFVIEKGECVLSEVKLFPLNEIGFTPNCFSMNLPINSLWNNNELDFKFEFFDYTETMANQTIFVENMPFLNGSPSYIQGDYNLLTGSQYIGNELWNGLILSGTNGSKFLSNNYRGFVSASIGSGSAGFMMWSGSVLYDTGSGSFIGSGSNIDDYKGIGVEMIADSESYFRFRTDPSLLEIRTDTFYLGGLNQYISGSGGKIEISSSYFELNNSGSLTATGPTFQYYLLSDFIANKVLTITNANKSDFLINYLHPTAAKQFSYLDLSAIESGSASVVRFETAPDYPISHIKIPQIKTYVDNQIGGQIVCEFVGEAASFATYFYDTRKIISDGNVEFVNAYQLSGSNSIHNLSGSFAYLGFSTMHTGSGGIEYTGSLQGKNDAKYIFTKGNSGWKLTSTSNFDRTGINLLTANIANLKGARRNDFIRPGQLNFFNRTGSFSQTFDANYNTPVAQLTLATSSGVYGFGEFYCEYLVPEYIKTNSVRYLIYYRLAPTIMVNDSYAINWNLELKSQDASVQDDMTNTTTPILNPVTVVAENNYLSLTQISSDDKMTTMKFDTGVNQYITPGRILGLKVKIDNLTRDNNNIAGKVFIYGIRVISDIVGNFGGFETVDITKEASIF